MGDGQPELLDEVAVRELESLCGGGDLEFVETRRGRGLERREADAVLGAEDFCHLFVDFFDGDFF